MEDIVIRMLRSVLSAKAVPYWAAFSVFSFGSLVTYAIVTRPTVAAYLTIIITVVLVVYMLFLAYAVNNETLRLSDIAGVKNYPYDTINSELIWQIDDPNGKFALLKKEKVVVAHEMLATVKEYGWGEGSLPLEDDIGLDYHTMGRIFRQGSQHVVEIVLDKTYNTGQEFAINYTRKIFNGFANSREWVETTITTNTERVALQVVFPVSRGFITARAIHRHGDYSFTSQIGSDGFTENTSKDGRKILIWVLRKPIQRDTYTIEWEW